MEKIRAACHFASWSYLGANIRVTNSIKFCNIITLFNLCGSKKEFFLKESSSSFWHIEFEVELVKYLHFLLMAGKIELSLIVIL